MRISDWSSDVCSSDLVITTNKPAPTEETEFEQGKAAAPTKRRRGLAMRTVIGTAKVVSRPYLEAGKSMKRLRGTLRTLGRTMAMKPDLETDSNFIDAPDSASAFESLYRAHGWTRSEARRVGQECVSTGRYRGARD